MEEDKKYKIVLSFGAAKGGAICAGWLRGIIAKELNISEDDIYFDVITLLDAKGTKPKLFSPKAGGGLGGMKPLNKRWKTFYKKAMAHADWMIFIITREWIQSKYCIQEFEWFGEQIRKQSAPNAMQKLKGLAIFLDNIHPQTHISNKFSYSRLQGLMGKRQYLWNPKLSNSRAFSTAKAISSDDLKASCPSLWDQWVLDDECRKHVIDILKSRYQKQTFQSPMLYPPASAP